MITVSFNAESTIERCIQSVSAQSFKNVEYIIIDGSSTDNTLQIIHKYQQDIQILISEPDKGIYDAMNKGIKMASGDVIGILNADDIFAYDGVLSDIALLFNKQKCDIVFADLNYVDQQGKVIRKWKSGEYEQGMFNWGWMPPHPTFYCKKELFQQFGFYSLEYGTAGDYELMLRFMHNTPINACYLNKIIINMKTGGISNKSFSNRVKGLLFDLKAMRNNGIKAPVIRLLFKPIRKISQYF